jgi:hypothetical protein
MKNIEKNGSISFVLAEALQANEKMSCLDLLLETTKPCLEQLCKHFDVFYKMKKVHIVPNEAGYAIQKKHRKNALK